MKKVKIAVVGRGSMSQAVEAFSADSAALTLMRVLDSHEPIIDRLGDIDVVVDLSHGSRALAHAYAAMSSGVVPVIGSSGISDEDLSKIDQEARNLDMPCIWIPNFCLGLVRMMLSVVTFAEHYDCCEISETHRASKVDAPSATALRMADMLCEAYPEKFPRETEVTERDDSLGLLYHGIPIHAHRYPVQASELCVRLMMHDGSESIEVKHASSDRRSFMRGIEMVCTRVMEQRPRFGLTIGLEHFLSK